MKRQKLGSLDVVVSGGDDREGGGDGPVVVLLHGFGAPGDDLVSLWRVLDVPRTTRFVFPAAPLSLASEGYGPGRAWWRIDMAAIQRGERRPDEVPAGLAEARASMDELLTHLEEKWAVPPSRIVLGGFSQGSMLSLDVALRRREPLAGLVLLSSTLIARDEWMACLPESGPRLHVFQSHGTSDPILPFALSEQLRDALKAAGAHVTWSPFRGGHEIPPSVVNGMSDFVRSRVS